MKLGILSDTHDEVDRLHRALEIFRGAGVTTLLHCGDITEPSTVRAFSGWTVHFVFGNCDWNEDGLSSAMSVIGATNHGRWGHVVVEGVAMAFVHGDDTGLLQELITTQAYRFIFHGHTHIARDEMVGTTRVINPGALQRATRKTIVVLDLPSGETATYEVP